VDWRLLVLIGGMTSFGLAMEKTGAARWLAVVNAGWTEPLGVYFVLGTFLAHTMLLTQPMSNAAAATAAPGSRTCAPPSRVAA